MKKIANIIISNKGTVASIILGLGIAGAGVGKMLFGGKNQTENYTDDENYDAFDVEESEPTEEATDEPE